MMPSLVLALLSLVSPGEIEQKPHLLDGMEARLWVAVQEHPTNQGLAEMTYRLTVTGPSSLEVQPTQLEDPIAAWKSQTSSREEPNNGGLRHTQTVLLQQVKPGFQQPPLISVRFRPAPGMEWQKAEWTEILEIREPPVDLVQSEPISGPWGWIVLGSMLLVVPALLMLIQRLRQKKIVPALPPEPWALQELQKLVSAVESIPSPAYHTRLADIVRTFLEKRWRLEATGKTTAEVLLQLTTFNDLFPEERDRLGQMLNHCDRARFAPIEESSAERLQTTEQARQLIQSLSRQGVQSPVNP